VEVGKSKGGRVRKEDTAGRQGRWVRMAGEGGKHVILVGEAAEGSRQAEVKEQASEGR
jgi:hypothetical protein